WTTPSMPTDPIAMNTLRIPSNASARSRGSSRRVGRMLSPAGSPKARRALPGSRTSPGADSPRASTPRTISLPTRPVAPITAVVIVPLVGLGDVAGDAAPRPELAQRRRDRLAFADRQRAARPEAAALAGIDDSRGLADVARVGEAELGT